MSTMTAAAAPSDQLLSEFERLLASEDSATEALTTWCRTRGLAREPAITAVVLAGDPPPPAAEVQAALGVDPRELAFRHVQLTCGDLVLSEAHNWYVPARLSAGMNRALATGSRPFGAVIARTRFHRERLTSSRGAGAGCPASTILTNRAIIRRPDGVALAMVVECYQLAVLGQPGVPDNGG